MPSSSKFALAEGGLFSALMIQQPSIPSSMGEPSPMSGNSGTGKNRSGPLKTPIVLGIDPSCQSDHTGVAVLEGERVLKVSTVPLRGRSVMQRLLSMPSQLSGVLYDVLGTLKPTVVAVEGQDLRARHYKPQDIVNLGVAAGIILGVCTNKVDIGTPIYMPKPVQWKGSIPKDVFQKRVLRDLDMKANQFGRTKDQQEHCIEAAGLALWALRRAREDGSL